MLNDKTVTRKIDENVSSNVKIQRELCAVTYWLDRSRSAFLEGQ